MMFVLPVPLIWCATWLMSQKLKCMIRLKEKYCLLWIGKPWIIARWVKCNVMIELQLWIGGHSEIEDENATLLEHYPLTNRAIYMCWMGSTFEEPIDDDDATSDEEDG